MPVENPFIPVDFDPFAEVQAPKFVDTTEPQREIWTSVKLGGDPANCAYNESVSLRLKGGLDQLKLIQACNLVVARHDALKSVFSEDGTTMIIQPELTFQLPVLDLSGSKQLRDDEMEWLRNEVSTPFSLERGPMIRFNLLKCAANEHLFVITAHHIVCDGWSISIIMQDIAAFYSSLITGVALQKEPAVQFSEYAIQEKQMAPGEAHDATEKFWLNAFKGVTETLELPIDNTRPSVRTFNAHRIDIEFDKSVIDRIKQIGAKAGCSFVNTLTVAFEVYLYRITGSSEIVLGIPASGQSVTGQYDLVGHCVNLLPLKSNLSDGTGFIDHLKKRKPQILDAFDHQQYTFGSLIRKLSLPRDPGRIPLVPVIFNVDAGVFDGVKFEGLDVTFYSNPRTAENFEIFINAANYNGHFIVECTYNTDLFDKDIMGMRMAGFNELLASIVADPGTPIDKLNILPPSEREKLLVEWNQTKMAFPADKGIHELFEEVALHFPENIALVSNTDTMTYRALSEKANRLAHHLLSIGITNQSIVALCSDRCADMVVALLAILKTGAAYLPLDPGFPKDRIQLMLDDARVDLLISQKSHISKLELRSKKTFLLENAWENHLTRTDTNTKIKIKPGHRAYVIYTSGSTGKPKGVQVSHQNVVNLLLFFKRELKVDSSDNLLALTTISFDIAGLELFLPLVSGARLTLAAKDEVNDANKLIERANTAGISIIQATPVTWRMIIAAGWKGHNNLNILCGGEALAADLSEQLLERCGKLWNVYGPTETTIWSTYYELNPGQKILTPYAPIGKPLANTQVYVLDKNHQPVPTGIPGELCIGGDGVSLGYLFRPELNEERFISDHFTHIPDARLYRTGDLVRFKKNGTLDFINRMDNQVKVRGYRIELGEIESVLAKHPSLKENVVITKKDKSGENRLVAYYKVNKGSQVTADLLKTHLQQSLPDYMVPAALMEMKEFPLTPNGKIDRKALPEPEVNTNGQENFIGSRTPNENLLASIWSEILGIEKISMTDDFFRLGGHSLLAVKLMMEIEKHRKIKLPLAILFTNSTIEKLARFLDSEISNQLWQSIVPIKTQGSKPPLFFAHGVSGNVFKYHALSELLPPDQPCYGLQAYGLNGRDIPFDNMEEMATYHISEILKFHPEGKSFSLAGGSFGGYLAFEMAYQLNMMGRKIDLVALFDIDAATAVDFLPVHQKYIKQTGIMAKRIYTRAVSFIKSDKEERERYLSNKIKSLKAKNDLDDWLDKEEVQRNGGIEQAEYFNKIEKACYKALMSYKIKKYPGKVILFRAKSGYFSAQFDYDLGWKHFAEGGVEIFEAPGDHNSIFNKGNVEEMAKMLSGCLISAQSR